MLYFYKMKILSTILIFTLTIVAATDVLAQNEKASHDITINVPEVALLGLVSGNTTDIGIEATSPVEAGSSIRFNNPGESKDIWINYSSITGSQNQQRKIVAFIQGEVPEGIQLIVEASNAEGSGKGKLGQSNGRVALTQQPTDIITGIGSCYTGKGTNNGHYLSYKLEYDEAENSYASLSTGHTSFQIIYTLTDHN